MIILKNHNLFFDLNLFNFLFTYPCEINSLVCVRRNSILVALFNNYPSSEKLINLLFNVISPKIPDCSEAKSLKRSFAPKIKN